MTAPIHLSRKKAARNRNVIWEGLNDFLAFTDLKTLSGVQRIASLAYWHWSHVRLGGYHDYFSTPPKADYSEVASALRAVGATEMASVLDAALAAVQAASTRAPDSYANRFAAGVDFADFTEFEDAFDRCAESFPGSLLDFVEKHEMEFIEWKP